MAGKEDIETKKAEQEEVKEEERNSSTETEYTEKNEEQKADTDGQKSGDEAVDEESGELEELTRQLDEAKDKYLRLFSEFENFRRRTAREKLEMKATASEDLMASLLPVLDDMDRAEDAFEKNKGDIKSLKEGLDLISSKMRKILEQKGLKEMESSEGTEFDSEVHEAITQIPAPSKKLKGKIVDTVEKGYYLDEKVIRYAKVVIGG